MNRIILFLLVLGATFGAFAESYSTPSAITNMTVGPTLVRVKVNPMSSGEGCSQNIWYALNMNTEGSDRMYSALLAAKASQQKIFLQLMGCHNNYPNITHVYICNDNQCSN